MAQGWWEEAFPPLGTGVNPFFSLLLKPEGVARGAFPLAWVRVQCWGLWADCIPSLSWDVVSCAKWACSAARLALIDSHLGVMFKGRVPHPPQAMMETERWC